jgi:hypothetical protein
MRALSGDAVQGVLVVRALVGDQGLAGVWHQVVVAADHAPGFDGIVNDYFLVRATHFEPQGEFTDDQLAAEHLAAFRWWQLSETTKLHRT